MTEARLRRPRLVPGVAGPTAPDEAAFIELVRDMHDDLLRVAFVVCGDAELAADAVQSAWVVAWRKIHTVRDSARVRSWLVAVSANEARQLVRRRRRHAVVEIEVDHSVGTSRADPSTRSADLDLANALSNLSPDDRMLLALRYVAGFNSDELGRLTGTSPSGIRSRLARLSERLRQELIDG